jgi:hypothetical protein
MFYNLRLVTDWRASPRQANDEALIHEQDQASQGHLTGRMPRLSDLVRFLLCSGVTYTNRAQRKYISRTLDMHGNTTLAADRTEPLPEALLAAILPASNAPRAAR